MIRKNEVGEFVFDPVEDSLELKDALREIFNSTSIGQTFVRDYFSSEREDELTAKLIRAARIVSGSDNVGASDLLRGLELLVDSGEAQPLELESVELAEPEIDSRPRDRNGKLLSPQQIAWKSFREWAETHSVDECRRRARTDAEFGTFMRKNLEREMAGGVGDAVTPVGTPTSRVAPTQELIAFAQAYQVEPSQNLRPKNGYVKLNGELIPYNKFIETVNRCTACGLL